MPGKSRHPEYVEQDCGFDSACWVWQRAKGRDGYGSTGAGGAGRSMLAHRKVYERIKGPIPTGLQLDHLCRNRACVNPEHLEPVSVAENVRRGRTARIDMDMARAIREARNNGALLREVAEQFGVTVSHVSQIANNKIWVEARA